MRSFLLARVIECRLFSIMPSGNCAQRILNREYALPDLRTRVPRKRLEIEVARGRIYERLNFSLERFDIALNIERDIHEQIRRGGAVEIKKHSIVVEKCEAVDLWSECER